MKTRWSKLGAICIIMTILVVLSSSLPTLEFRDAQQRVSYWFETEEAPTEEAVVETVAESGFDLNLSLETGVRIAAGFIFWILIPIALLYSIFTRDGRRALPRAIAQAIIFGIGSIALYIFVQQFGQFFNSEQRSAAMAGMQISSSSVPTIVLVSTSAVVALMIVGVIWLVYRQSQTLMQPKRSVVQSAQRAIVEIDAGADLRSVVMRCYSDMLTAARRIRGVERDAHVTPSEFSATLQSVGLPIDEVDQLTRLFESVRYGGRDANSAERATARACLTTIIETCKQHIPTRTVPT